MNKNNDFVSKLDSQISQAGWTWVQVISEIGNRHSQVLNLSDEKYKKLVECYRLIQSEDYTIVPKGKLLEELTGTLFDEQIFLIKKNFRTSSNELDILVGWNQSARMMQLHSIFPDFGEHFICECKNYTKKVGVTYVGKFFSLLRVANVRLGIMVAWNGVTGRSKWADAQGLIKKIALKDEIFIVTLDQNDFRRVYNKEANIFTLVNEKCVALKQDIDYIQYIQEHEAESEFGCFKADVLR